MKILTTYIEFKIVLYQYLKIGLEFLKVFFEGGRVFPGLVGVDSPAVPSAADGSEKPVGAKPTGHGVAGLRARRHRYPDALCG